MKFNFHTHTTRCRHADGSDEELVQAAAEAQFTRLGFADHCPCPDQWLSGIRMRPDELTGYVHSLSALRKRYRNKLSLFIGLECEYFPAHLPWLLEEKERLGIEYLILGHHYWPPREEESCYQGRNMDSRRILLYAESAVKALSTGHYLYFAHPDLFVKGCRDPLSSQEIRIASREICQAAKALSVPLEFNLLGLSRSRLPVTEENCAQTSLFEEWCSGRYFSYPYPIFWEEAALAGCTAVVGVDAHSPQQLLNESRYRCAFSFLRALNIPIVDPLL